MSIIISLDLGTSKVCAVAYCTEQNLLLGYASVDNGSFVKGLPPGHHEQSPKGILEHAFLALKTLLASDVVDAEQVVGIAITGQMHGVLPVDRKCNPVTNLITWRDQRTSEIAASVGDRYARNNGCGLRAGYGGATLSYLAKKMNVYRDFTALSISDYVCACLCGEHNSEPTLAASWGIYDITMHHWNLELLHELSIPTNILPKLKPSSKGLGLILPHIAKELGLRKDVVIFSPIGDNQASVIGARRQELEAAVLNLGTGGQISIPQNRWQYFDGFETRPMPDNTFILVGASICGGWAYAYLKDFYKSIIKKIAGVDISDKEVYARMNSFLDMSTDKSELYVNPWFCGTRADPKVQGEIKSIGVDNLTPERLTRAFAQSMVRELFEMTPSSCMGNFTTMKACGNAIRKNPSLLRIISDYFGKPVSLAKTKEEAALGAALIASDISFETIITK